jgi:hypothetical protein
MRPTGGMYHLGGHPHGRMPHNVGLKYTLEVAQSRRHLPQVKSVGKLLFSQKIMQ